MMPQTVEGSSTNKASSTVTFADLSEQIPFFLELVFTKLFYWRMVQKARPFNTAVSNVKTKVATNVATVA